MVAVKKPKTNTEKAKPKKPKVGKAAPKTSKKSEVKKEVNLKKKKLVRAVENSESIKNRFLPDLDSRAGRMIEFIETYCHCPEGMHVGSPFFLEQFEIDFIVDVYNNPHGTDIGVLSMAKKNGKTALIACLVLGHLVGPEARLNSQIVSGAMSRDQASIVFKYAVKIIDFSPDLKGLVVSTPSTKTLTGLPMNTTYIASSADAATSHGKSPLVVILDEMGQIKGPSSEFVESLLNAQGAYDDGLVLVISTQASHDSDWLSIVIDRILTEKSPHEVCHLYAAQPECDVLDEKQWKKSNPALGVFRSERDLRKLAIRAAKEPTFTNTFRNYNLNQRVVHDSPFLTHEIWQACKNTGVTCGDIRKMEHIFGGLDLSMRKDLTAYVQIGLDKDFKNMLIKPYFFAPKEGLMERVKRDKAPYDVWAEQGLIFLTKGAVVDYQEVAKIIAELNAGLPVEFLGFDRYNIEYFKKDCNAIGVNLPLIEVAQDYKTMSPAIDKFEELALAKRLEHDGNPVMQYCIRNTRVLKNAGGQKLFDKKSSTSRIDGSTAVTIAISAWLVNGLATKQEDIKPFVFL